MVIGELLKLERQRRGLTLRQAALELGMDAGQLWRMECGKEHTITFIPPIARWLGQAEDEVRRLIAEGKSQRRPEAQFHQAYTMREIDALAERDRERLLSTLGKGGISCLGDLERAAIQLYNLLVSYDPALTVLGTGRFAFAALCIRTDVELVTADSSYVIIVNPLRQKRPRGAGGEVSDQTKAWNILHELGHYVLHVLPGHESKSVKAGAHLFCSSGDSNLIERQANRYASVFLMPETELRQAVAGRRTTHTAVLSRQLCYEFFVTKQMLEYRFKSLGISHVF